MWESKGATMIRKVAQSQALREAFPNELRGLYQQEEMGRTEKLPEKEVIPGMASNKQKNMIRALAAQKYLYDFDNKKDTSKLEDFCTSNGYCLKELKFEEADEVLELLVKYEPKKNTEEIQDVEYTEITEDNIDNIDVQETLL